MASRRRHRRDRRREPGSNLPPPACPSGNTRFATKLDADRALADILENSRSRTKPCRVYECNEGDWACYGWHLSRRAYSTDPTVDPVSAALVNLEQETLDACERHDREQAAELERRNAELAAQDEHRRAILRVAAAAMATRDQTASA